MRTIAILMIIGLSGVRVFAGRTLPECIRDVIVMCKTDYYDPDEEGEDLLVWTTDIPDCVIQDSLPGILFLSGSYLPTSEKKLARLAKGSEVLKINYYLNRDTLTVSVNFNYADSYENLTVYDGGYLYFNYYYGCDSNEWKYDAGRMLDPPAINLFDEFLKCDIDTFLTRLTTPVYTDICGYEYLIYCCNNWQCNDFVLNIKPGYKLFFEKDNDKYLHFFLHKYNVSDGYAIFPQTSLTGNELSNKITLKRIIVKDSTIEYIPIAYMDSNYHYDCEMGKWDLIGRTIKYVNEGRSETD